LKSKLSGQRLLGIVLGLLLAVHLILLGFFQISDEDTWWHLKQGELYVSTRSLPAQDPFAFTTSGRPWIHYSWAADILFYLVFRAAGTPGLVLFRLLLLFLVALILYRLLRGCGLHPLASILFVFVGSLALGLRLWIRPEILSFPLLLGVMAILLRLQAAPPRAAYTILPVQVVWTNVHASFVFGLALPGLVLLANLLPGSWPAPGWGRLSLDRPRLRHLAATVACLPFASLLNPRGVSLLLFPFRQNQMTRLTWFTEWKPVWYFPNFEPAWLDVPIVLGLVLLTFAITAVLLLVWEGRLDPVGWGIVLLMGTYAIFRLRAIPHFVLAVLPLLALALVRIATHLPARSSRRTLQGLERIGVLACLLVLSASVVAQAFFPSSRNPHGFGVRANYFPEGAVSFLQRHHLDGRVFNTYEFGGYLIWRRWPANQVLIDGRYDGILFDEALLEAYIQAYQSPATLDRITAAYQVDILVLDAHPDKLIPYIGRHPGWALVYWDPIAEVYVRRGERHADLIATHEYRLTRSEPDLSYLVAYRRDPETWAQALTELRRAVEDNPENAMAWLGLAQEYRAAGPAAVERRLEALTRAQALLAGTPLLGRVHADRAEALLQLGRLDEAAAEARTALRLQEDLILPQSVLADVAQRRGAWGEARDHLRTILTRLEASDARVPLVQSRLKAVEQNLMREGGR
jgi:tetratricopeptide (TPR) repeat protein